MKECFVRSPDIICYPCLSQKGGDLRAYGFSERKARLVTSNFISRVTTMREGTAYIGYGNYCGAGGSGPVMDPIDGCCKEHDECYLVIDTLQGCMSVDTNFMLLFNERRQELNCGRWSEGGIAYPFLAPSTVTYKRYQKNDEIHLL
ncbi:Hypothetical predicted protein [Mytilus galloprovincialis]|uniref:Phospholipase A2 n=1 Tax=Mytilus galloprovincialis TaxID=29158 RepID=A0A8B6F5U4_MYTGA|nr:Hypothetical predicted protein [Mytilus galloprovincialis]